MIIWQQNVSTSVNDQNVQKATYRDVTDILKSARGTIKLLVQHSSSKRRSSKASQESKEKEIIPGKRKYDLRKRK